ncbi:MAG: hypothetical protein P8R04_07000, partial [Gammaproteobacteria bacterium]|nr:hypothetical protein [Gammaproteobacteria bacterium]
MRCISIWMILLFFSSSVTQAQVNNEAFRDYFLVGQFGEVCTMCEVVVLCEASTTPLSYESIPEQGTFRLYYIQTRTFWSQVSTIWEWFITNFRSNELASRGHVRPVWVYQVIGSQWAGPEVIEGRLVLDPGVIQLADYSIERVAAVWQQKDKAIGYCQRMDKNET